MRVTSLKFLLKSMEKHRSTQIYQCDALWVIASSLGSQLARYSNVVSKKPATADKKTTEEVVGDLISVLKRDIERRTRKNGSVQPCGSSDA